MDKEMGLIKPTFDGEIQAKIKQLGEIESNIANVRDFALQLNTYYSNIIFDENSMSAAKDEKAKVNKFKNEISSYRKDIIKQWKEPIDQFETMAKETEKILGDTYDIINKQCDDYNNKKKEKVRADMQEYMNELIESNGLDFLTLDDAQLNITLNASEKSLKTQLKEFCDRIESDIKAIEYQADKDEILVEYKKNGFNLSMAIKEVQHRHEELERERKLQEERLKKQEELKQASTAQSVVNEEFVAPKVINQPVVEEKKYKMTFTVQGTMEQLKRLKEYLRGENLINE